MLRFKHLYLLLILPLILGFTSVNLIPSQEIKPQPLTIMEEMRLLEDIAQKVENRRQLALEQLIAKQEHLQELGWYKGEVDGIKGPLTKAAIKNFADAADVNETSQQVLLTALQDDGAPEAPPPPPPPAPTPTPSPAPSTTTTTSSDASGIPSHWLELARCESGNWVNGGASFEGPIRWHWAKPGTEVPPWGTTIHHGGFQFHPGTWSAYRLDGYPQYAYDATPQQQLAVAERVQAAQGFQAWPTCARKVGLLP